MVLKISVLQKKDCQSGDIVERTSIRRNVAVWVFTLQEYTRRRGEGGVEGS